MSKLSPDYVFLGLLEYQSCHGYQLQEHFRDPAQLGNIWRLSTSQLYAILKRLERDELIDGREEDSVDAPMRTVYWLTEKGQKVLSSWLDDPQPAASTRNIRTEFLSRLYIARLLGRPTRHIVEAQRAACERQRALLVAQREELGKGAGYLSLDLSVAEMSVIMDWLVRCEQQFTGRV
jgi:DNA-binding PadR family transcriptional regulator